MRFNMINWLLETVSLILVMIKDDVFLTIFYLLVNSCGTPLVILFTFLSSDWDWDLGLETLDLGPGTWDLGPEWPSRNKIEYLYLIPTILPKTLYLTELDIVVL